MAAANPSYDILGAVTLLLPGVIVQQCMLDAANEIYTLTGFRPLTATQVPAILQRAAQLDTAAPAAKYAPDVISVPKTLPAYPTSIVRIPDSNPEPVTGWTPFTGMTP